MASEACAFTKKNENRLLDFEITILRRISWSGHGEECREKKEECVAFKTVWHIDDVKFGRREAEITRKTLKSFRAIDVNMKGRPNAVWRVLLGTRNWRSCNISS